MSDVRSVSGIPTAISFASSTGTPIVVDITTGRAYVLLDDGSVEEIPGTGGGGGGGVTDHGALTGLGDDDHTQYHNNTRGDARYSQLGHSHSYLTQAAADALYAVIASQVPTGGTTGQALVKSSNTNYAMAWSDVASGGGGGTFDYGLISVAVDSTFDYGTL